MKNTSPNCLIKDSSQHSNSFDVLFQWSSFKILNTSLLGVATGACHYGHLSRSKAGLIWLASKLKRIIQLSAATVYHQLLALCFFWIRTSPEGAEPRKRSPTPSDFSCVRLMRSFLRCGEAACEKVVFPPSVWRPQTRRFISRRKCHWGNAPCLTVRLYVGGESSTRTGINW